VFLINWGRFLGRLDPLYYSGYIAGFIDKLNFDKSKLHSVLIYAKNGFAAGKDSQSSDASNSYLQIRPTNIDADGILKFDKNVYVDNPINADVLCMGEVLFNNTNSQELVGKTGLFDLEGNFCCSNHITRLMPNQNVSPNYLKEILNFYFRNNIFYSLCTNWNNQSGVNYTVLKDLLIPVPTMEVQHQIVDIMDTAHDEKREKEQKAKGLLDSINGYLLDELGIVLSPAEENTLENRMFFTNSSVVMGGRLDPRSYTTKYQKIFGAIEGSTFDKKSLRAIISYDISGNWGLDETEVGDDLLTCLTIRATEFDNKFNLNLENNRVKYRNYKPQVYEKIAISSNEILVEKSGGSDNQPVGRVAFIEKNMVESNNLAYSNFIHKIIIDENLAHPRYVFEYLRLMHNIKITEVMQTQTNGIRNLIMQEYFSQAIILPNKSTQERIADEASRKRASAKSLEDDANIVIQRAKEKVEKILLSGSL